ncbi:MAG: hypothetical protein RIB54_20410 [Fulvivirga sp.]|uniref:hypothetical protein n=1 Tax=Fulvivirga sp. TaxID=1931237 RepID=UPI0032EB2395
MNQALGQFSIVMESDADSIQCKLFEISGRRERIRELIPEVVKSDSTSGFHQYKYLISEIAHTISMDITNKKQIQIKSINFIWPNKIIRLETPEQIDKFLELKPHMILNNHKNIFQVEFTRHKGNYIFFKGQVNRYEFFNKTEENYFSNTFTMNALGSRSIGFMVYFVNGKFHDGELPYQYELMQKMKASFVFTEENYSKSISMISIEFPFMYSKDTVTLLKENMFLYNGIEVFDYSFVGCKIQETDSSFKLTNASIPGIKPRIDVKLGILGFEWYPLLFYVTIFLLLVVFNKVFFMTKKSFFKMEE